MLLNFSIQVERHVAWRWVHFLIPKQTKNKTTNSELSSPDQKSRIQCDSWSLFIQKYQFCPRFFSRKLTGTQQLGHVSGYLVLVEWEISTSSSKKSRNGLLVDSWFAVFFFFKQSHRGIFYRAGYYNLHLLTINLKIKSNTVLYCIVNAFYILVYFAKT